MNRTYDFRAIVAWAAGIGALTLALLLLVSVTGLADSGDFDRVMSVAGLRHLDPNESYEDRFFHYTHRYFGYGSQVLGGYVSTHALLVLIAGWIGAIWDGNRFDIRVLGLLYAAMWAFAVALIVRASPTLPGRVRTAIVAVTTAAALMYVFGDIGYQAYFQSFYGEPYALIGMLLAVGAALAIASRERPSAALFALFVAAVIAVATSKIQNAPIGLAFALLAWRMLPLRPDRRWRRLVWAGLAAITLASVLMLVLAPDRLRHVNLYQSIFFGVLRDSPNVSRDMEELGIPDKYAGLAGTNYFQKDTVIPQTDPDLHREVLFRLSHRDIALFYARHPARFVDKLHKAAENGAVIRPGYLGNFAKSEGKPSGAISHRYGGWSNWKAEHMPHSLGWFAGCFVLFGALAAVRWARVRDRRARLVPETLGVVALTGLFAVGVSLIGDGEADLGKHLFMFNVAFDMLVVSAIVFAVWGLIRNAPFLERPKPRSLPPS